MAKRDPHDVLGVERGAALPTVKAAWRRLAREHHPDLTGDDPGASRVATRRMAEINDAYESLRRDDATRRAHPERQESSRAGGAPGATGARPQGPPRPRPGRPVTGRVDTSDTFRPRNSTTGSPLAGDAWTRRGADGPASQTRRSETRADREPPRASDPTGPLERGRIHRFRPPAAPSLDTARAVELEFGKFRGHTLGEVAAFEPSYVDWLARTITRDRELVAAARVVRDDLDERGVPRRERPDTSAAGRSA